MYANECSSNAPMRRFSLAILSIFDTGDLRKAINRMSHSEKYIFHKIIFYQFFWSKFWPVDVAWPPTTIKPEVIANVEGGEGGIGGMVTTTIVFLSNQWIDSLESIICVWCDNLFAHIGRLAREQVRRQKNFSETGPKSFDIKATKFPPRTLQAFQVSLKANQINIKMFKLVRAMLASRRQNFRINFSFDFQFVFAALLAFASAKPSVGLVSSPLAYSAYSPFLSGAPLSSYSLPSYSLPSYSLPSSYAVPSYYSPPIYRSAPWSYGYSSLAYSGLPLESSLW